MASPRSAAAVILVREKPALEVFWMRRAPHMMFQGGFYAFPGGQLDPNEDARVCASRELFEETGARVDPAALVDVGRWVTPAFAPRRFDTCFFLATCPEGENPHVASDEHDLGKWVEPGVAVDKWMEGQILAANPVLHALRCLAEGLTDIEARMKVNPWAQGEAITKVEMRPGIVLVPLRTPTLPPATHTNCYVVGGDEVVVIDPASPYEEEQAVLDGVLAGRTVREIWLTHLHRDHVGGANHLKQRLGVKIAAHAITAVDLEGVVDVDRRFEESERLELPGRPGWSLRILHTPGHACGHVCVFEEKSGSLITGDLMAGLGTVVIDPPEGHMATYLDSLRRMRELPVTALFPAHGPVMANARAKIQEYIDHRLERERKILAAWQGGARQPAEIVKEVYTDVPAAMHGLAERSVLAHLEKLREEKQLPS
jgi:glyoxylase-like metal-dependent hydrolase (beta-lactamase superfamily II)/8-oxo-dGTP pyrophosphatase MutT (NUDIX family)